MWGVWREESHEPGVISIVSGSWIHCVKYQTMQCQECRPETQLSDARDLFFPRLVQIQIREASTSYMKSEPVRSGRWETWPELYKLSNTSLLGDEYFLREEVVQWRCSIFFFSCTLLWWKREWIRWRDGYLQEDLVETLRGAWCLVLRPVAAGNYNVCLLSQTLPDVWLRSGSGIRWLGGGGEMQNDKNDSRTTSRARAARKELGEDEESARRGVGWSQWKCPACVLSNQEAVRAAQ